MLELTQERKDMLLKVSELVGLRVVASYSSTKAHIEVFTIDEDKLELILNDEKDTFIKDTFKKFEKFLGVLVATESKIYPMICVVPAHITPKSVYDEAMDRINNELMLKKFPKDENTVKNIFKAVAGLNDYLTQEEIDNYIEIKEKKSCSVEKQEAEGEK